MAMSVVWRHSLCLIPGSNTCFNVHTGDIEDAPALAALDLTGKYGVTLKLGYVGRSASREDPHLKGHYRQ
jgi:hypothetical protein